MIDISSWVIVIVNLNLKFDTYECIISLLGSGAKQKNIIIVDNGSVDGSVEFLKNEFSDGLTIIEVGINKGYAYALNLGIKIGMERNARWFLLMNNDTIVDTEFLTELSAVIKTDTNTGLYGPLILYYSQPDVVWYLGDRVIPGTLITINPFRGRRSFQFNKQLIPVDFVHGCGMLVRRDVFERIGDFDDSSLIYGEEIDFIWRARLAGYNAVGVPSAKMWHKISAVMSKQKPKTRYLRIRNQIRFYKRYSRGLSIIIMFFFTIIHSVYLGIKDLFRGDSYLLKPLIRGWLDGWFLKEVGSD